MMNAVAQPFENWLAGRQTHTVTHWTLLQVVATFLFAVTNYLPCAATAPEAPAEGPIDLDLFYWRNLRLIWGLFALQYITALPTVISFNNLSTAAGWQGIAYTLPFLIPCALAIGVRARWAQWTAGAGLFALTVVWAALVTAT